MTESAQAGLIAGTVPTNGNVKRLAQFRQCDCGGGVARDHDEIGALRYDQFADDLDDAGDQRRFFQSAVRKRCVVGRVHKIRVRQRRDDFAIDGEAAEAGIEYQYFL